MTPQTVTTQAELTAEVLDRHAGVADPRLKQIITSLISHLHAFASEVRLTQQEWAAGIDFLTQAGHITDDRRQEFVLLSDTLGLSMLVDLIDHQPGQGETESTVLGPFYRPGAPWLELGSSIARPEDGDPLFVSGHVLDTGGAPIAGAAVEAWEASRDGKYDVQDDSQPETNLRGNFRTDENGRFFFWGVRPVAYPIPDDGPVGKMLAALGRHPWRAPHIHFIVSADGFESVTTHVFDAAGDYLDSDTVFGVKASLLRPMAYSEPSATTPGHYRLDFDFVLGHEH